MAELVHGFALDIHDVPRRGLVVRIAHTFPVLHLEPAEAAELGRALIAQADEAIHASRASRRAVSETPVEPGRCRSLSARSLDHAVDEQYRCLLDEGHGGAHRWSRVPWV